MISTLKETIEGFEVSTTQFPAMRGFEILARLTKTIGPVLGAVGSLSDLASGDGQSSIALAGALSKVEPKELSALLRELLQNTQVLIDDKYKLLASQEAIDGVFSGGKILSMIKVAVWVARSNYPDFFDALGAVSSS